METRILGPASERAAADLITEALLYDPGWLAVGPDRAGHRRLIGRRYHLAALRIIRRWGGPVYGAFVDGRLAGVAATLAAGRYPPPAWTLLKYVPGFLLAGPGPVARGLRVSALQDRGHPLEEHVFLWFLAVAPAAQRRGTGRALLERVVGEAGAPVYLEGVDVGAVAHADGHLAATPALRLDGGELGVAGEPRVAVAPHRRRIEVEPRAAGHHDPAAALEGAVRLVVGGLVTDVVERHRRRLRPLGFSSQLLPAVSVIVPARSYHFPRRSSPTPSSR